MIVPLWKLTYICQFLYFYTYTTFSINQLPFWVMFYKKCLLHLCKILIQWLPGWLENYCKQHTQSTCTPDSIIDLVTHFKYIHYFNMYGDSVKINKIQSKYSIV